MGNERARPAGLRHGAVVPRDVDHHRDARRVVHRAFEEGATGAEMRPLVDGDSVIGNTLLSGRVSPPAVNSADHAVGYREPRPRPRARTLGMKDVRRQEIAMKSRVHRHHHTRRCQPDGGLNPLSPVVHAS
jgi:hypothetical protein